MSLSFASLITRMVGKRSGIRGNTLELFLWLLVFVGVYTNEVFISVPTFWGWPLNLNTERTFVWALQSR